MSRSACFIFALMMYAGNASVLAAPPQSEQFVDVGLGAIQDIDCGSFAITYELSGERARVTTFFDNAGNATRMQIRWTIFGTLTQSVTGQTLRDQAAISLQVDLNTDRTAIAGMNFHYAIPGKGLIFLDAGRIVVSPDGSFEFLAGPKDSIPNFAALCNALAT